MPVQYRLFYFRKLVNIKEKENAEMKRSRDGSTDAPSQKVVRGPGLPRK